MSNFTELPRLRRFQMICPSDQRFANQKADRIGTIRDAVLVKLLASLNEAVLALDIASSGEIPVTQEIEAAVLAIKQALQVVGCPAPKTPRLGAMLREGGR